MWAIVCYCVILLIYVVFQRSFIYFPRKGPYDPDVWKFNGIQLIQLKTADNKNLYSWYRRAKPGSPTLVLFHGNAGSMAERLPMLKSYIQAGWGVLILEYRGYGLNKGDPTEEGLYYDGDAAMRFLARQEDVDSRCIVLYGHSLGSAVATKVASYFHVGGVVLSSSFTSVPDLASYHYWFLPSNFFLIDRFDNSSRISSVRSPILYIHGEDDKISPIFYAKKLYGATKSAKKFISLKGVGHNNLPDISDYLFKFVSDNKICENK